MFCLSRDRTRFCSRMAREARGKCVPQIGLHVVYFVSFGSREESAPVDTSDLSRHVYNWLLSLWQYWIPTVIPLQMQLVGSWHPRWVVFPAKLRRFPSNASKQLEVTCTFTSLLARVADTKAEFCGGLHTCDHDHLDAYHACTSFVT